MKKNSKMICSLYQGEQEYVVNGVKYIVGSYFQKSENDFKPSIADRFTKIITNGFVPLTTESPPDIVAEEYVCSTAGKED